MKRFGRTNIEEEHFDQHEFAFLLENVLQRIINVWNLSLEIDESFSVVHSSENRSKTFERLGRRKIRTKAVLLMNFSSRTRSINDSSSFCDVNEISNGPNVTV